MSDKTMGWGLNLPVGIATAVAAATVPVVLAVAPAQAATSASGTVQCLSGDNVVGVWIDADGGSGWASWSPQSGYPSKATFRKSGISGSWTVSVGCGGSSSSWKYAPKGNTRTTRSTANWSCYTPNMSRPVNFCQLA